jgi:protein SCO1/2
MNANHKDFTMGTKPDQKTGSVLLVLGIALALCAAACGGGSQQSQTQAPAPAQSPAPAQGQRYHLTGTIVSIDKEQKHLIVNAGDIPGFMSAMTMPYPVADEATLDRVGVGDQITADIVVGNGEAKLENVVVVKKGPGTAPASPSGANRQPGAGDKVPDFALLNEDGKRVHLDQYHGKAVLLTFIYTRCPLPDYCPLMSHNFAQIEQSLTKTPAVYSKTHLLSISFDPKYDTPAVLRKYANAYVADPKKPRFDHWEFASILEPEKTDVARFFNLFLSDDGGQITHSMSTAIIDPAGNLYRTYPDNSWKPMDVLNDLTAAVTAPVQERSSLPSSHDRS